MEWSDGYVADIDYANEFYRELSPQFLNFACVLNGFEPVPLAADFTYFELGCGQGGTLNLLAASNPQGRFYGADFMPSHIAAAHQLADAAGLENLTVLENSFAALADGAVAGLPQFDFITMHGVYTWVNSENQRHIVRFLNRYLKPGGVVYVSYNAMPGWAAELPLKRLLLEYANGHPDRSDRQIREVTAFIQQFNVEEAGYFTNNSALKEMLALLESKSPNYLAHEYLHQDAQPLYHLDVARQLAVAKLDYVGSADLCHAWPAFYLNEQKLGLLESVVNPALRETVKDFLINSYFRKDIFVRGARKVSAAKHNEQLQALNVSLLVPLKQVKWSDLKAGVTVVELNPEVYGPALAALARESHSVAALAALPGLRDLPLGEMIKALVILAVSGQLAFHSKTTASSEAAFAMNRALANEVRFSDACDAFASPLIGNGTSMNLIDRLVYFIVTRPAAPETIDAIILEAQEILSKRGRRLRKNGKIIESDDDNNAEIALHVNATLANKIALWRQLQIL